MNYLQLCSASNAAREAVSRKRQFPRQVRDTEEPNAALRNPRAAPPPG